MNLDSKRWVKNAKKFAFGLILTLKRPDFSNICEKTQICIFSRFFAKSLKSFANIALFFDLFIPFSSRWPMNFKVSNYPFIVIYPCRFQLIFVQF